MLPANERESTRMIAPIDLILDSRLPIMDTDGNGVPENRRRDLEPVNRSKNVARRCDITIRWTEAGNANAFGSLN